MNTSSWWQDHLESVGTLLVQIKKPRGNFKKSGNLSSENWTGNTNL